MRHDEPKRVEQAVNHHFQERRGDDYFRRVFILQRLHPRQRLALAHDEALNYLRIDRTRGGLGRDRRLEFPLRVRRNSIDYNPAD